MAYIITLTGEIKLGVGKHTKWIKFLQYLIESISHKIYYTELI